MLTATITTADSKSHDYSPTKSNPRRQGRMGCNVLGRKTGLWSTEAKVWGIVPKDARRWDGDSSVANDPFVVPGIPRRMHAFRPHGALLVVTVFIHRFSLD
jgi:hypothetical protein